MTERMFPGITTVTSVVVSFLTNVEKSSLLISNIILFFFFEKVGDNGGNV